MKVINLRDIYPHYTQDCFVEVTDEVADLFSEFDHKEAAYGSSSDKSPSMRTAYCRRRY